MPPVFPASPTSIASARRALEARLGSSRVRVGEALTTWSRDDSPYPSALPDVVVLAETAEHVRVALEVANSFDVPLVPRAGGTGRTGGALPVLGGIVLSTAGLSTIEDISREDLVAVVGPGVVLGDLHAACSKEGLFYPPDPSSLGTCMIGGNVATNAGGPRAFLYGSTRSWVAGVDAVTGGGVPLSLGGRTRKRSSGYELGQLLVGSEGTLAVATRITLKLLPKPPETLTLAVWCRSDAGALAVSKIVLGQQFSPACVEFMDERTLAVVTAETPTFHRFGVALLMMEFDGEGVLAIGERLGNLLADEPDVCMMHAATEASQREALWRVRRDLSHATRRSARFKLSEDIVVPRGKTVDFLGEIEGIAHRERVRHLVYGHAGDGNLHVNFLWEDDEEKPRVEAALDALMRATLARGGSLSGEHGIGVAKQRWFGLEHDEATRTLQHAHKAAWDPRGILNPGKVVGGGLGHGSC